MDTREMAEAFVAKCEAFLLESAPDYGTWEGGSWTVVDGQKYGLSSYEEDKQAFTRLTGIAPEKGRLRVGGFTPTVLGSAWSQEALPVLLDWEGRRVLVPRDRGAGPRGLFVVYTKAGLAWPIARDRWGDWCQDATRPPLVLGERWELAQVGRVVKGEYEFVLRWADGRPAEKAACDLHGFVGERVVEATRL